MKMAK